MIKFRYATRRDREFPCKVVFSKELTTALNILGREGFFEYFQVTFNERGKEVILEKNL